MSNRTSTQETIPGVVIRGANGEVYMIPQEDLEAFRAPEEVARHVNQEFEAVAEVLGSSSRLTPEIERLTAVRGAVLKRDLVAGPTSPTVVPSLPALRNLRSEAMDSVQASVGRPVVGKLKKK
jgi:hypothetical protein